MISIDTSLIVRVERTIRRQGLFNPVDTLVVALSGGADSSALLDLLTRLPDYPLRLIVAHLNHSLRGGESDADEEFCRELAARYSLLFECRKIDVNNFASKCRLNLEDAGRRARIEFLDEIRGKFGAAAVALAHHADDQAETMLMRLLRGSGMTGLSGMAYRNARGYVRPLLDISRAEIEQYLRIRGLKWREDASNSDTIYLRNRIRHELLPLLEEYNPAIRSALVSAAAIIGGDETLLIELTERTFAESCRVGEGRVLCGIAHLRTLNPALRRRILRHAFKEMAGTLAGVSRRHIDSICDLITSDCPNARLALPHGIAVVREYDSLIVMRADDTTLDTAFELPITEPGSYQLPSGGCLLVDATNAASFPPEADTVCFDLAKAPFPWLIRTFRPGDRIVPFGMSGRKKVKDVFIDRKIPVSERARIPLLFQGNNLIWIAGVCASQLCRIGSASGNVVRVTWQP